MQWVSAHGDSALVGILFWIPLWKVLLGRSEKKAPFFIMVCFPPFVHCCFAFRLRACMGVYINVISLWQPIGSFSGTRKKNKFV